jgi:hypothetical protein
MMLASLVADEELIRFSRVNRVEWMGKAAKDFLEDSHCITATLLCNGGAL